MERKDMYKICVIMGGVLPVPAVCGGAIETLVTSIAKKYSPEDGYELTICSVFHPKAVKEAANYPDVRFVWTHTRQLKYLFLHALFLAIRISNGKSIRPLQRHYNEITKLFEQEKFDLIVAEGGDTQAIVDIAKGYKRDQFVNHVHIHYLPPENIVKAYGHVIGVSDFVTKEYLKVCSQSVKGYVLQNGINTDLFRRQVSESAKQKIRRRLGIDENDFVVLFVGRIMQIKGVMELITAVLELKDPSIKLLIMGGANSGKVAFSSYQKKVKELAEKNKDRILFAGYVKNDEVYRYAAVAEIECLPSVCEEACPLTILEGMSMGKPIIATRVGGVPEILSEEAGLFIEKENLVENLKQAIVYLKDHPQVRNQMSEQARKRGQQYSEDRYYQDFKKLTMDIIRENQDR